MAFCPADAVAREVGAGRDLPKEETGKKNERTSENLYDVKTTLIQVMSKKKSGNLTTKIQKFFSFHCVWGASNAFCLALDTVTPCTAVHCPFTPAEFRVLLPLNLSDHWISLAGQDAHMNRNFAQLVYN